MGPMVFAQGNVASDHLKLSEPVPSLDKAQRGLGALSTTFLAESSQVPTPTEELAVRGLAVVRGSCFTFVERNH